MSGEPHDRFGLVGRTIADRVRVDRVIGEGGFGVVYEGVHLLLGKPVAIKCHKGNPDDEARSAQIFLREGQILFELAHPAIVRLFDVGIIPESGVHYAVLERITGRTLREEIEQRERERRPFTRDEIGGIFVPILEGLAFAHGRGVVHRDLKPANIMLPAGESPKILDFGTARSDSVTVDATLGMTFTPLYAAPEQWDGRFGRSTPATDVYAIGLTMLHACMLRYPLPVADTLMSIMRAAADDTSRPRLPAERPDLPAELGDVLLKATRARAEDRYADARELCAAVRRALGVVVSTSPLVRPMTSAPPPALPSVMPAATTAPQPASPSPLLFLLLLVPVALLLLGGAGVLVYLRGQRAAAEEEEPKPAASAPAFTPKPLPPGQKHRTVRVGSVVGGTEFWSQADLTRVLASHRDEVASCADQATLAEAGAHGEVSIIVHPTAAGDIESIQCSMMVDGHIDTPFAHEMCTCLTVAMGRWKLGRAKPGLAPMGRNFIVSFQVEP